MQDQEPVHEREPSGRAGTTPLAVLAAWVLLSLLAAATIAYQYKLGSLEAAFWGGLRYLLLLVLAIPVWRVSARLSLRKAPFALHAAAHLGLAAGLIALWQGTFYGLLAWRIGEPVVAEIRTMPVWLFVTGLPAYVVVLAVVVAVQATRRLQAQQRRESELLLLAREAELRALKAQIRPHFLFNALNSIYSLIESQPQDARMMVERLADLFRRTLDAANEVLVPLAWEVGTLEAYLQIEQVRLGPRLTLSIDTEPEALGELVPPLILQPVVENAIKHGIAPRPGPGSLGIQLGRCDGQVVIRVRDTGPGLPGPPETPEGHGLWITRRRLENAYGGRCSLEYENLGGRGLEVRIRIPAGETGEGVA